MKKADAPQPPSRSRWHEWWKIPLFFGVLAAAILLEVTLNAKGAALFLLVLGYFLVRGLLAVTRKGLWHLLHFAAGVIVGSLVAVAPILFNIRFGGDAPPFWLTSILGVAAFVATSYLLARRHAKKKPRQSAAAEEGKP